MKGTKASQAASYGRREGDQRERRRLVLRFDRDDEVVLIATNFLSLEMMSSPSSEPPMPNDVETREVLLLAVVDDATMP